MVEDGQERVYYPSVTTITQRIDKGIGWNKWLGNSPSYDSAMEYADRAAQDGDCVHALINWLIQGYTIKTAQDWYDSNREEFVKLESKHLNRLQGFIKWWAASKPEPLASEIMLCGGEEMPWAGCADLVCVIKNKTWLIDYKTGAEYHHDHEMQLTAYRMLWNYHYPEEPIDIMTPLYLGERGGVKTYSRKYKYLPDQWLILYDHFLYLNDNKIEPHLLSLYGEEK